MNPKLLENLPNSITVITDTSDENAAMRIRARLATLFPTAPNQVVGTDSDIAAGFMAVDVMDAGLAHYGQPQIIILNRAPREHKKFENGNPYGLAWYKNCLIVGTVAGYNFTLLRHLKLIEDVYELDVTAFMDWAIRTLELHAPESREMSLTQFRTLRLAPFAALGEWLHRGKVPVHPETSTLVEPYKPAVAYVDRHGNVKLNVLASFFKGHSQVVINDQVYKVYDRMQNVPRDESAIITGSSGTSFNDTLFAEIIVQGGSAAREFRLEAGAFLRIEFPNNE